jgi:hypothetical protein
VNLMCTELLLPDFFFSKWGDPRSLHQYMHAVFYCIGLIRVLLVDFVVFKNISSLKVTENLWQRVSSSCQY